VRTSDRAAGRSRGSLDRQSVVEPVWCSLSSRSEVLRRPAPANSARELPADAVTAGADAMTVLASVLLDRDAGPVMVFTVGGSTRTFAGTFGVRHRRSNRSRTQIDWAIARPTRPRRTGRPQRRQVVAASTTRRAAGVRLLPVDARRRLPPTRPCRRQRGSVRPPLPRAPLDGGRCRPDRCTTHPDVPPVLLSATSRSGTLRGVASGLGGRRCPVDVGARRGIIGSA
jgi:hypothetical protein